MLQTFYQIFFWLFIMMRKWEHKVHQEYGRSSIAQTINRKPTTNRTTSNMLVFLEFSLQLIYTTNFHYSITKFIYSLLKSIYSQGNMSRTAEILRQSASFFSYEANQKGIISAACDFESGTNIFNGYATVWYCVLLQTNLAYLKQFNLRK